jgi:hypothetical protein
MLWWARKAREASLLAVNPGAGMPRDIALTKPAYTVGSARTNDLVLPHDSVSREHATIRLHRGNWQIIDRKSTNGTFANSLRASDWVKLRDGHEVRLGGASFIFRVGNSARGGAVSEPTGRWRASRMRAVIVLTAVCGVVGFAAAQYFLYRSYHRAASSQTAARAKP